MNTRIHLLSCGKCRRQLDVTRLEVGDEVQCVCDTVLIVGPPKEVTVRGTACGHCGGVIGSDDPDCRYCGAELSAIDRQATTLCPVCAIRLPNGSRHCSGCGVELRASAVPPLPRDGACPRCDGQLRVHLLPEAEVIECGGECGGLWCSREAFERLQASARQAATSGEVVAQEAVFKRSMGAPDSAKRQYVPCLTCSDLMQRRMFRYENRPSGVVLDVCKDHGVWFDHGELASTLAFVRAHLRAASGLDGTAPIVRNYAAENDQVAALDREARKDGRARMFDPPRKRRLTEDLMDALGDIFSFSLFD